MVINKYGILCLMLVAILGVSFANASIIVFGTLCFLMIFIVSYIFFRKSPGIKNTIYLSWMIEIIIMLIIYNVYASAYGLPYDMEGTDDFCADIEWSDGVINDGITTIQGMARSPEWTAYNNKAHIILIVWTKSIAGLFGGYHTLDIRLINLTFCILTALIMGQYARKYLDADDNEIKQIIMMIGLLPNAVFISSLVYRDVYVAFLIVLSFYLWTNFKEKGLRKKGFIIVLSAVILYVTFYLRMMAVIYILASIAVGYSNEKCNENYLKKNFNPRKIMVFLTILALVVIFGSFVGGRLEWYLVGYTKIHANSSGMEGLVYSIPILPFGWLIRTVYYMMLPMYWRDILPVAVLKDPVSLIRCYVTWGTIYIMFAYPYLLRYLKKLDNICVLFVILLFSTAILTGGFRHIMIVYPMMFTMCVVGKRGVSMKRCQDNLFACGMLVGLMAIAAMMIRIAI